MDINYAFLCDYADPSGGKMSAIGIGFDTIFTPKIPTKHPLFYAVINIRFTSTETGQKRIGMHLIDADGNDIMPPLDTTLNAEPPPPGFTYRNQQIALAMHGVTFPHYGDYTVSWLLNEQEVKALPLRVAPPPTPPTTM